MKNIKYELTDECIQVLDKKLYRIKALRDIKRESFAIQKGDLGGFIEKEENLTTSGNAWVYGDALVCGNAEITSARDYIAITPIGSRNSTLTAYRCITGGIEINTGCFSGTIDDFITAVNETHRDNEYGMQYLKAVEFTKLTLSGGEINHDD